MKFSLNYVFFPNSKALEKAIEHFLRLMPDQAEAARPDTRIAVQDVFIHTRGHYEQHRFSSNVLEDARACFEDRLSDQLREESPVEWAETCNSYGNVLAGMAQQLHDESLYDLAVKAFRQALDVEDDADSDFEGARTRFNLGTALLAQGRLSGSQRALKDAVTAYTDALLVWTRENSPEEWTSAMFHLGMAFHEHGKLLKGNRTFQKAVVSYKNALAELDADLWAMELVATHNNRGAVLHHLAESEDNPQRMEEAIRAYNTGLTVAMEQQLPFHLAVLCRVNKATANAVLAAMTGDTVLLDEVADEFELIIECFDHALQPMCKQYCEKQLVGLREELASRR